MIPTDTSASPGAGYGSTGMNARFGACDNLGNVCAYPRDALAGSGTCSDAA